MLGAESWMFSVTDAEAMFPAWSKASPVITWFAPDVVTTIGGGHVPIPERESEQVKVTVTGVLLIPPGRGFGEATAVTRGGVRSTLALVLTMAVFPAASMTVPATCWFAPGVLTVCGAGQVVIGATPAVQMKLTVTGL